MLLLVSSISKAQKPEIEQAEKDKKVKEEKPRKEKKEWENLQIYGVRLGTDIVRLSSLIFDSNVDHQEFNSDLILNNKYFIAFDFGASQINRNNQFNDFDTYKSEGTYFRIGADYNLIRKATDDDGVSLGLRYARSSFKHTSTYRIEDPYWGTTGEEGTSSYYTNTVEENKLSADWIEFVVGLKLMVFNNFYLSPNLRFMFKYSVDDPQEILEIAEIPGYGKAKNNTNVNTSLTLSYRIPLVKKLRNPGKKKKETAPIEGTAPTEENPNN